MKTIDKKNIERYLRIYQPEYRFLEKLQIEYPHINATFKIPPTFYTRLKLNHVSEVEMQLCLNQMAYIGFMEAKKEKKILPLDSSKYIESPFNKMLIGSSEKRFRKMISSKEEIHGSLEFKGVYNISNKTFVFTDFDFEKGKCTGKLNLVVVYGKEK